MRIIQFVNLSEWCISLLDDTGDCFLWDLKPGKSRDIDLYPIYHRADVLVSGHWRVGVLKDGKYANIHITGYQLELHGPRYTFKTEKNIVDGKKMLRIEATKFKFIDIFLTQRFLGALMRNNKKWDKRPTILVAREKEGQYQHQHPRGCCHMNRRNARATVASGFDMSSSNNFMLSTATGMANAAASALLLSTVLLILQLHRSQMLQQTSAQPTS